MLLEREKKTTQCPLLKKEAAVSNLIYNFVLNIANFSVDFFECIVLYCVV